MLKVATRITSPTNPRVKELVRLRERRAREAAGVAPVEGAREVLRAVSGGWRVRLIATCAELSSPEARAAAPTLDALGAERIELSRAAFEKVSLRQHPDGVLALVEPPTRGLEELAWGPDALYLVADGLEKPGNLGALLRSADAADVDAVFVTGAGTDLLNPQVVRASMGSVFARPVVAVEGDELRAAFRRHRVRVVTTSPHAAIDLWDADLERAVAIVLGTEHEGLSEGWTRFADVQVRVPMAGLADSLNVATTGALLLFEARRQRRGGER
jgi:RNA methyltransferase, TrmH family